MPVKHSLHHLQLDNGIEGYVVNTPGSSVTSYEVSFGGGYHYANVNKIPPQASHVLEHILMGWVTDPMYPTRTTFVKELRKNGAYSNGHTNASLNWYDGSTTNNEWQRVLDCQRRALSFPRLDEAALKAESGNAKEEMKRNVGDNSRLAYELALRGLTNDVTTSADAVKSIDSISKSDVVTIYDKIYTRRNTKFILAGDFKNDLDTVREHFGTWGDLKAGDSAYTNDAKLHSNKKFQYVRRESLETIYAQLTLGVNRRLTKKERLTLRLINNYLFSDTTSKVTYQAREKGWCYGIGTYIETEYGEAGLLSLTAPISPLNVLSLFHLIVQEVRKCATEGISRDELESVKSFATGRFIRYGQTMEEMIDIYSDFFAGDAIVHADEQLSLLQSVTSSDISRLLSEFLESGLWSVAGVGGVEESAYNKAYTVIEGLFT